MGAIERKDWGVIADGCGVSNRGDDDFGMPG